MSNDLTNSAKLLLHRGKGDPGRLDHIITTLNEGKNLYSSDQEYLEDLIEKYLGAGE